MMCVNEEQDLHTNVDVFVTIRRGFYGVYIVFADLMLSVANFDRSGRFKIVYVYLLKMLMLSRKRRGYFGPQE